MSPAPAPSAPPSSAPPSSAHPSSAPAKLAAAQTTLPPLTASHAFDPARAGAPPQRGSWRLRYWSVRRSRALEWFYNGFERNLVRLAPLFARLGWQRLERPTAMLEAGVKGALFDCRMCGQCMLSSSGMSCPMNCPKALRNGPCGGVRANGNCEVYPGMPCVWVEAWEGSQRMRDGDKIRVVQPPVDNRLKGRSSWMAVAANGPDIAEQPLAHTLAAPTKPPSLATARHD
ncbi:MAG: methylenetetrahydrofolate reductase C-terminal domain-containing protein [Pseudomonadota bacterium]